MQQAATALKKQPTLIPVASLPEDWRGWEPDEKTTGGYTKLTNTLLDLCYIKLREPLFLKIALRIAQLTWGGKKNRKGARPASCALSAAAIAEATGYSERAAEIA